MLYYVVALRRTGQLKKKRRYVVKDLRLPSILRPRLNELCKTSELPYSNNAETKLFARIAQNATPELSPNTTFPTLLFLVLQGQVCRVTSFLPLNREGDTLTVVDVGGTAFLLEPEECEPTGLPENAADAAWQATFPLLSAFITAHLTRLRDEQQDIEQRKPVGLLARHGHPDTWTRLPAPEPVQRHTRDVDTQGLTLDDPAPAWTPQAGHFAQLGLQAHLSNALLPDLSLTADLLRGAVCKVTDTIHNSAPWRCIINVGHLTFSVSRADLQATDLSDEDADADWSTTAGEIMQRLNVPSRLP